jgi:hypothetical protein
MLAGAALVVAWLVAPAGVPLYDGVGFPDEAYRYVQPPPGYKATPAPTDAVGRTPATSGVSRKNVQILSGETGPQVVVYVPGSDLIGPDTATAFELRATPVAPGGTLPDGAMDGNIYRVQATATPPGPVRLRVSDPKFVPVIDLRAVAATEVEVTAFYRPNPAAEWSPQATSRVGTDIYETTLIGLGDYVLTVAGSQTPIPAAGRAPPRRRGPPVELLAVAAVVAVLVIGIVVVRLTRSRTRP